MNEPKKVPALEYPKPSGRGSERPSPIQEAVLPLIQPLLDKQRAMFEERLAELLDAQRAVYEEQIERRVSERVRQLADGRTPEPEHLSDADISEGSFYLTEITHKFVPVKVTFVYPPGPDGKIIYAVIRGDNGRKVQPRTCEELFPLDYAPPAHSSRLRPRPMAEGEEGEVLAHLRGSTPPPSKKDRDE